MRRDGNNIMSNENKNGRPCKAQSPFTNIFRSLIAGATQQEVANRVGVSRQNVGKWLSGETTPDINTLVKIADAYEVTTDFLLGRTDVKTMNTQLKGVCEYTGLSENSIRELHNGLTQMGGDETIAVIPFKVLDADRAYFRYLYLKDRNICKCIDEFFKKKDSKELIMLIYDYVFMADECNINSEDKELMFIALQYEIIDRLKHWRETSHNQNPKGDE
jgi:transcriptional regulator with XRE-family HTH domain